MLTTDRSIVPASVRPGSTVLVRPGFNNDFIPVEVSIIAFEQGNNGEGFTYMYPGADTPSFSYFTRIINIIKF